MLSRSLNRYTSIFTILLLAAAAGVSLANQVQSAPRGVAGGARRPTTIGLPGPDEPREVPGQVVVRLAAGVDPQQLGHYFGLRVKEKLRFAPNTYIFDGVLLPLEQVVQQLKRTPGVIAASPNAYLRMSALPRVTPEDPLYNQQWVFRALNAEPFWGITVGERLVKGPQRQVVVALLDAGPLTTHEDLAENIDPRGFDFINGGPYDVTQVPTDIADHGTQMAGCIAAVTNNQRGIASLPWEAVKVLPCRVGGLDIAPTAILLASAVDALYYSIQEQVDVVNMSFGTPQDFDLFRQAIQDAYNQGIVLVGASGNSRGVIPNVRVDYPARYDEVIAVGAVGPFDDLAYYSNTGLELELVAPGGNDSSFAEANRQILSTTGLDAGGSLGPNAPEGYGYSQGTSQATAYVSGAIATLLTQGAVDLSLGPTEQVQSIRTLLQETARNAFGQRTTNFGFGILDVARALQRVTQYIDITTPIPGEVTASFSEPLEATIVQPVPTTLDPSQYQVFQNGQDITDEVELVSPASGTIRHTPTPETRYNIGLNRINIIAESTLNPPDPDDPTRWSGERSLEGNSGAVETPAAPHIPARAYAFRVEPRRVLRGLQTLSIPYTLPPQETASTRTDTLQFLFGGNLVRLARWVPEQNRYAIFDIQGSPQDPEAQLKPPPSDDPSSSTQANLEQVGVRQPPAGLGFWARVESPTQAQLFGTAVRAPEYEIQLKPGFNLIGNPYPFRVPYNSVRVRFGNEIMSVQEAADRGLMRNTLWRWEPQPNAETPRQGDYTLTVLPQGELIPWEAQWVRSSQELTLLVPRVASGIQLNTASLPSASRTAVAGLEMPPGASPRERGETFSPSAFVKQTGAAGPTYQGARPGTAPSRGALLAGFSRELPRGGRG